MGGGEENEREGSRVTKEKQGGRREEYRKENEKKENITRAS